MDFLKGVNTDNIMLLNTIYHYPNKERDYIDYLDIVYKDLTTGEKYLKTIESPEMDVYFAKKEFQNYDYNKDYFYIKDCDKYRFKYKNLIRSIADVAGDQYKNYFKMCQETHQMRTAKNIHHLCPYVFGSDYDIEYWYRIMYKLQYHHDKPKPITIVYLDIETDNLGFPGFAREGECPINAITVIDDITNTSYTFLLRNEKNPLIAKFESNIDSFRKRLHDAFDETYGHIDYKFYMYDDEVELITDTFKLINTLKRDFLLIWNLPFDIPYIQHRLKRLGVEPSDVMCHKDFKVKDAFFRKDVKNFKIENKKDYFKISSHTVYLDQMVNYAQMRKGQSELRSHRLGYVAWKELQDNKLDYSDVSNMKELPYTDFELFVMYNIKDVLLQLGIERRTHDTENIYLRSYTNSTPYEKIFSQTRFLECRGYIEYFNQGLIIGNNHNIDYGEYHDDIEKDPTDKEDEEDDDDVGYEGALVGDPTLNDKTGIEIFGILSMYIFDNVVDFDFSAMYPNINIAFNISPSTLYGKLLLNKLPGDPDDFDAGKEFLDNLLIGNPGTMGSKWFNLPSFENLYNDFQEEFNIHNKTILEVDAERLEFGFKGDITWEV